DLNNDGHLDVVFANYYNGGYGVNSYLYWGDGTRGGISTTHRTELPTQGALAVAAADLNQDGYQDLVFANYYNGSYAISSVIYWGSGTGYSAANYTLLPTLGARAVEIADLDEDGYLDLVFANHYNGGYGINSYIYWGSAGGYSTQARASLLTYGAIDVGAADLNNDGHLDLVFANHHNGSYLLDSYIYWGDGTRGGFSASQRSGLPTQGVHSQAVADFNHDGYLDLAFANSYNGSSYDINSYLYWGSSTGFTTTNRLELPTDRARGVSAADLNNDSWAELLFTQSYNDGASNYNVPNQLYWNSPAGFNSTNSSTFPGIGSYGLSVASPSTGDPTAFGRVRALPVHAQADFRVASGSSAQGVAPLTVAFDNLSSPAVEITTQTWDFGDGATSTEVSPTHEYAQPGHYTVTLTVNSVMGNDSEVKPAYIMVGSTPSGVTTDLDRDGYVDLVVSNYYNGSYVLDSYIYWGTSVGYTDTARTSVPTQGAAGNLVADLNNDGHLDVVFANYYNGGYGVNSYLYWGDGTRGGISTTHRTELPTQGALAVAAADLNQDGYQDLVFANHYNGSYAIASYLYWGSATGYSVNNRSLLPTLGARAVEIADLDENGYLDLVFANYYNGGYGINSYIYWGSAVGYSTQALTGLLTYGAIDVGVADLNNDSHLDLVFANHYNGSYLLDSYIYWGDGTRGGFNASHRTGLPTQGAHSQAMVDFNHDGYRDIAFANIYDGSKYDINSYLYWGSSTGFTTTNRSLLPTDRARGALAVDLNRDGWEELLFTQEYDDGPGSYNVPNRLYWNSPAGFNSTNVSTVPGVGSYGVSAAGSASNDATGFGRSIPRNPLAFESTTPWNVVPLTVTFSNLASSDVVWDSFAWDFGDGSVSAEISPTHVYTQSGVYTVILQGVTNGVTQVLTIPNYIVVASAPNVSRGKWASASSTAIDSPLKAVDQKFSTAWTSSGSDGSWLQLHLNSAYNLDQILIGWGRNTSITSTSDTALIQTSLDGKTWNTIYTDTLTDTRNTSVRLITPPTAVHAAYIRVYGQSLHGNQLAVTELQAFGAINPIALNVSSNTILAPGVYTFTTVSVVNSATLTLQGDGNTGTGLTIFAENIQVDTGSKINGDGQGYVGQGGSGYGPGGGGGGTCCGYYGGGGGYGSRGGDGSYAGGVAYGSI
ncbi:hypothetical protein ANRL4_00613, partial [Anaerolineae bacterium]